MSLSIKEEKQLPKKVKQFPVLYDKAANGCREKDSVNIALKSATETLDFAEDGN